MIIRLMPGAVATLEDPEDLKRFKLVAPQGLHGAGLAQALGHAGRLEGEHAWISPDWLRRASGMADDPEWRAGFGKMLEFAARHGWVNDKGEIRAHIERD